MQIKNKPAPKRKLSQKQFDARQDLDCFQFQFHELFELTFKDAIQLIEADAILDPTHARIQFSNAFEAYQRAHAVMVYLEEHGCDIKPADPWLEPKWYVLSAKDLFDALKPTTQQLLLQQGLQP
jgi:hypothetical protein